MSAREITKKALFTGCLCAAAAEILHGMSYAFTKQSTNAAGVFFILGWRFLIAAAVMTVCIAVGFIKVHFKGKPKMPLLRVILLCPCVYFLGETLGISRTTSTECGIFVASIPVISLILSAVLLKNHPSRIQVAGIVTTLIGMVTCVTAVGMTSSLSVPGYVFLTVAVLSYSLYFIYVEKASVYTSAELAYAMQISGAALFTALALLEALHDGNVGTLVALPFRDRAFLTAVLYLGIGCSVFAFWLSNAAIEKLGVNRAASFIGVATLVSVLTGTLMLREPLTPVQIVGAVLIVIGVYMANAGRAR